MIKNIIKKSVTLLELIRLPGMFTAHADILAGFLIAGAGTSQIRGLFFLLLASSCLFSAGMALNDYFDRDIDKKERPERPIPSGRISGSAAKGTGFLLLAAGLFFALLAGPRPFLIGLALASAILLYDGLLKHDPVLGPLTMASCRYFNLLMGLSLLPFKGFAWIPLITMLYILGVTLLSQKEAEGGKAYGTVALCGACIGLSALIYYLLFLQGILPVFLGVILMAGLSIFLSWRVLQLLTRNSPADFQKTMKVLLLSIILLDAVIAAGSVPVYAGVFILLLFIPAKISVKLFQVT